jgi:transposase
VVVSPRAGVFKTVTIKIEADGWYVAFACVAVPAARTVRATGIDVCLKVFLVTADTAYVANSCRCPAPKADDNGGYAPNGARRKAGLNAIIPDAGWRQFHTILADTVACAGKCVAAVDPADTRQDCSGCGQTMPSDPSVRTHVCTHCGPAPGRSVTAAKTIFWRGQRLWGVPTLVGR